MTATALRAAPLPIPTAHESLAGVARDLRLPLSHIKGYVSSLRRSDLVWDDDTRSEFLAEIEQEVDRLAQMVDPLLHKQAARSRARRETNAAFTDPGAIVSEFSVFLPLQAPVAASKATISRRKKGNDAAKHARRRRRGADAQAAGYEPQGQRP